MKNLLVPIDLLQFFAYVLSENELAFIDNTVYLIKLL